MFINFASHLETMINEPLDIRTLPGADIFKYINCAYIARKYFKRTRSWFTQRLNNNKVNGKPVSFSSTELSILHTALNTISMNINSFSLNLQPSGQMKIDVYLIKDREAIDYILNDDLDSFTALYSEQQFPEIPAPHHFSTEQEAQAFCAGIALTQNDQAPSIFALRSFEPCDSKYIDVIRQY